MRLIRLAPAALLLTLAACGGGDEKTTTIDTGNGKMTVSQGSDGEGQTRIETTGDNGEKVTMTAGPATAWPADAPAFAPALPGATVVHTMGGNDGKTTSQMVMYETTTQSPEEVVAFYKEKARAAGLGKVTQIASAGNFMFGAEDEATGRTLSVQAGKSDGKTSGAVTYAIKPKG
ncbi:hypothetical protein IP88_12910 [alpha proteobacterium AAP81b]|nr:hypothetical protein IP88_12910 [alpha proteobacterium AAP81b]